MFIQAQPSTPANTEAMPRRCFSGFCQWVRGKLKFSDVKSEVKSLLNLNIVTLGDHIPSAVYTTDVRLIFIVTAVYASLVAQFTQNANQETEGDISSGMNFKINAKFTNHSISGGVSDRILWNCREDSRTNFYYRTLFLGLILSYFLTIVIYFLARVFITLFVANTAWRLTYDCKKTHHLELMANGLKMINQLKRDMDQTINSKRSFDDFKKEVDKLATDWNKKWHHLVGGRNDKKFLYNWLTILYIIPRYETLIMLAMVTFALTSYDIHPLGCLSHIDVSYNETEMSVTLNMSQNVIRYQQASVILIGLLFFHWGGVKTLQYLLLPRRWGLLVSNFFSVNLQWAGSCVVNRLFKKCKCSCEEAKCCSMDCILPCGESESHYDNPIDDLVSSVI